MTIIFSDDFNRASLGATNWSDESGTYSISGSTVLACSTSNQRALNTTTTAHAAIADVLVSARRASATFDGCIIARSNVSGATSSAGNCYFLNWFDTNTLQFFRRIAGTNNQVGANVTATHANGDKIGLKVTGTGATVTLTAYVNDVQVGTEADIAGNRIVAAGQTGFIGFNSNTRYDDFSVDDLIDPGTHIDASVDAVVIAEQAATVRMSRLIAAGVDALTITELQAAAGLGLSLSAGVDALVLQEQAASIGLTQSGLNIAKTFRYPSPLLRM